MISLSANELQDFQQSLNWFTGTTLPDGRILGNPSPSRVKDDRDPIFQLTKQHLNFTPETSLIEFGCAEGAFSVYLAPLVKRMVCVEVRPRNIINLLTRLFVHDIRNVEVWLKDVSVVNPNWGKFDILFHVGVLYHLINPVAHLFSLRGMADQLVLNTHYGTDAIPFPRCEITENGKSYPGYIFREQGWQDPYSGVQAQSCWLRKDVLLDLLKEIGYKHVEIVAEDPAFNLPRFTVIAKR